jgi:hypothetical protein
MAKAWNISMGSTKFDSPSCFWEIIRSTYILLLHFGQSSNLWRNDLGNMNLVTPSPFRLPLRGKFVSVLGDGVKRMDIVQDIVEMLCEGVGKEFPILSPDYSFAK